MESPCLQELSLFVSMVRLLLVFGCCLIWERKVWAAAGWIPAVHCSRDNTICNISSDGYYEIAPINNVKSIIMQSVTFAGAFGSVCMYLDFTIVPEAKNQ